MNYPYIVDGPFKVYFMVKVLHAFKWFVCLCLCMQATEVGGGSSERGVTGGEPSNFRANDRGYDQIFGVWARGQGE